MSNEADHFFERQDEMAKILFLDNKADELTDILVSALEEALRILTDEAPRETRH